MNKGGLRFVMNLVLKQPFNLTYIEHKKIYKCLYELDKLYMYKQIDLPPT